MDSIFFFYIGNKHQTLGACPKKEFLCSNGDCLPFLYTCNGVDDCKDGSDENITDCYFGKLINIRLLLSMNKL